MTIRARLESLGLDLPPAPSPAGNYVPAVRSGNLIFVSGQIPLWEGAVQLVGKVGDGGHGIDAAAQAARYCVLNALAIIDGMVGLERVTKVVRLGVHVNSAPGFRQQPAVANGASDLLVEIFGERGRHSRTAVGVSELPLDASVEIDFIFELSL